METQCQSNVDSGQLKSAGGQRVGTAALLSWGLLVMATGHRAAVFVGQHAKKGYLRAGDVAQWWSTRPACMCLGECTTNQRSGIFLVD